MKNKKINKFTFPGINVLQEMYDSEINFTISTFWDNGFLWMLGDRINGYLKTGLAVNATEAIFFLHLAAVEHYPKSDFVKKLKKIGLSKKILYKKS